MKNTHYDYDKNDSESTLSFKNIQNMIIGPNHPIPSELSPITISRDELLKLDSGSRKTILTESLKKFLAQHLKIDSDALDDVRSLISLGIDSLQMESVRQTIEDHFQIDLLIHPFFESDFGVNQLSQLILSNLEASNKSTLPQAVHEEKDQFRAFSLTELQHAYWIGRNKQIELGGFSAHIYLEYEVTGHKLDGIRLSEAFEKLIQRHAMLRMMVTDDGRQKILEHTPPYIIKVVDLQNKTAKDISKKIEQIRQNLGNQIFPLNHWPLFDICLTHLDSGNHRIHISLDLMVVDYWSYRTLFYEWFKIYQGEIDNLPSPQISFRDYVNTLPEIKTTPQYVASKHYWQNRIDSLPPAPQLAIVKNPNELKYIRFGHRSFRMSKKDWSLLKDKAMARNITPSNALLAAFCCILSSWSRTQHFCLNLTMYNRFAVHPDINTIIGDFTSTFLLEVNNKTHRTFKAFAAALQKQVALDLQHRYYSGIEVIRDLSAKMGYSSRALMPVVFTSALTDPIASELKPKNYFFKRTVYTIAQTPQVAFDHQVFEENGELVINWDIVEDLFPPHMLDDMFKAYTDLLMLLLMDKTIWETQSLSFIPKYQLAERIRFNSTEQLRSSELLNSGFLKRASAKPHAPAILTQNRTISYGELLQAANTISHKLKKLSARPNELVAILMDKGWEQIVAVLGILQSGSAYLNIDPDLPVERKKYLLKNASARIVLTTTACKDEDLLFSGIQRLTIDDTIFLEDELPVFNCNQPASDLAYVIYTSGSTGLPKGVMISHKAAVNTVHDINQKFQISEHDRVFAISSLSFDLSVYDIFGTLSAGAALVIPKAGTTRDPEHWFTLLQRFEVTVWNSVPALMEMLVDHLASETVELKLGLVMLSGDWIPINLPERIWKMKSDIRIISLGGATEASIWSIYYPIEYVDTSWASIPYGWPLSNQEFYVFNQRLEHCPDRVPGDLYIGGDGLAQGYWKDKQKTDNAFIIHPENGKRLYKTGDMGRFLPEGYIEFLGREDSQIKIGGYRVEIGEIESTLNQHDKIRHAAVKKITSGQHNDVLSAYIVLNSNFGHKTKTTTNVADYEMQFQDGDEKIITDPMERLRFKLTQPGLRRTEGVTISLERQESYTEALYVQRATTRRFLDTTIPFSQFSRFLNCLRQIQIHGLTKYQYGSAGGLYPVQIYLHINSNKVDGLLHGAYYYNPQEHCLEELSIDRSIDPSIHVQGNRSIFKTCAFSIFLISRMDAIKPMYGKKARDFSLIEAGLITQLLEQSGVQNKLGLCQIGNLEHDDFLMDMFKLSRNHILLHTVLGGPVDYADPSRIFSKQTQEANEAQRTQPDAQELLSQIKLYCHQKLPKYMVPGQWTLLNEMPLSPVGKVNYKALPAPSDVIDQTKQVIQKPTNELERLIADIFQEKIGIQECDIDINFFDLGASSLTVTKAHRILRAKTNKDFPVIKMFEYPSIRLLANYLSQSPTVREETQEDTQVNYDVIEQQASKRRRIMSQRIAKRICS